MTESKIPDIEITDEVVWHDIINMPHMYIEDAGLDGVRWVFIAHVSEFEEPNKDVDNDHLLEGDSFEPRWLCCGKCWQQANEMISKEMLDKVFGEKDGEPDGN